MSPQPILRYPDPRLSQVAMPVECFDAELVKLAEELLQTMRNAPGVGITAAHIGIPIRLVVLELAPSAPAFYVNPEILQLSSDLARHTEGSVSMPGITEEVERPASILFRYQDLSGQLHDETVSGFPAVCVQHEVDQLDGIFWLKRLSRLKRERAIRRWQKQRNG